MFQQRDTEFHLEEEAAPGTTVGEVSASDRDEGDNALIDYVITCEWGGWGGCYCNNIL